MNKRQQLYKKYRLEGLSGYKSAIAAGYSKATAINAHRNLEKRCNFEQILLDAGIDDQTLGKICFEGLQAMRPVACDVMIKNENGELKVNKNSNDWIEYEDWNVRHKFLETILKLTGKLKDKSLIDMSQHTNVVYNWQTPKEEKNNSRIEILNEC